MVQQAVQGQPMMPWKTAMGLGSSLQHTQEQQQQQWQRQQR
jgi:hypothetical protein